MKISFPLFDSSLPVTTEQWQELVGLSGHLIENMPDHLKTVKMYKLSAKSYLDILSHGPNVLKMDNDFALSIVKKYPHAIL